MRGRWRGRFGWLLFLGFALVPARAHAQQQTAATPGGSPGGESASANESNAGNTGGDEGPSTSDSTVGYIDPALPLNMVRFRYDNAHGDNRPTRGTFQYARYAPDGPGLPLPESNVDYQELSLYGEHVFGNRFSLFAQLPVQFGNFRVNQDQSGLADMFAGFKYAFYRDQDTVATFQWKTYAPTGNPMKGLGNSHASIEPAFLLLHRFSDLLISESEFHYWVPVGGPRGYESEVIRYGTGLGYTMFQDEGFIVRPVVEVVGWTFLNGKEQVVLPDGVQSPVDHGVGGTTIINLKGGVRFRWDNRFDIYAGYGHALTGAVLYKEIARVEFRWFY